MGVIRRRLTSISSSRRHITSIRRRFTSPTTLFVSSLGIRTSATGCYTIRSPEFAPTAAFWLALRTMTLGQTARASGWQGRTERLVDPNGQDCAECGYLRLLRIFRFTAAGDHAAARTAAAEATTARSAGISKAAR